MVCHAEASSKLQKRPIRSVSILPLDNCWGSSALMEDFPGAAQRRWLGQDCGCGWLLGSGGRCLMLVQTGAGCSHPPPWMCDFTDNLIWLSGRVSCPSSWFTFPPHTAVLKPACIFLDVAILWNPLVCSCRISFFLIPNSPCCPHQSCQCAQCTACLYSLWSSRTCSSREQPWAMVTFWCYLPVSAYITLPFFIVYSWATSVLLLLRLHSLSE